jgi:hypothetical protein
VVPSISASIVSIVATFTIITILETQTKDHLFLNDQMKLLFAHQRYGSLSGAETNLKRLEDLF